MESANKNLNRRALLTKASVGGAAISLASMMPFLNVSKAEAASARRSITSLEVDILNFALNLEYLEAEFYAYAVSGVGLPDNLTSGRGRKGVTTGGVKTTFTDPRIQSFANELAADETNHVKYLRKVLGSKAIAKPAIKLDPLGSFATENAFLSYSRAFEDTGVSAYSGAAGLLKTSQIISAAARVLAVEAYHSGVIRQFVAERNLTVMPIGGLDQIPSSTNLVPTDDNSLAIMRSTRLVKKIVAPFFPEGLNGNIK